MLLYAIHKRHIVNIKETNRLKVTGWKKIYHANIKTTKTRGAILISHKKDINTRSNTKENV